MANKKIIIGSITIIILGVFIYFIIQMKIQLENPAVKDTNNFGFELELGNHYYRNGNNIYFFEPIKCISRRSRPRFI